MTDINEKPEAEASAPPGPKRKGWPKGKPRGNRPPVREAVQKPLRERAQAENGRVAVRGRDGEILTRKRTTSSDLFYIPPQIIPDGYDYQWNTVEVMGQQQVAQQIAMAENGWRPVPAGRHKGMFMPATWPDNGDIVRDGLRLEERPLVLTQEARQEEAEKASRLMRDQQEQLGLSQKMPDGFSRQNDQLRRMERSGTSRSYGPAPDVPRPRLPIEQG